MEEDWAAEGVYCISYPDHNLIDRLLNMCINLREDKE